MYAFANVSHRDEVAQNPLQAQTSVSLLFPWLNISASLYRDAYAQSDIIRLLFSFTAESVHFLFAH